MKILVTGGAGFIGSAVIRHLIRKTGHGVINLDKLTYAANISSLNDVAVDPRYRFIREDICNRAGLDAIFQRFRPDAVMHLAAESHVDRSIENAAVFVQTNVVGTFQMLEAALGYWRSLDAAAQGRFRFHHVSTDEVFGSLSRGDEPFCEITPYDPRSPYAASKASADHFVRAWMHSHGLPVIVTNCTNNYGPYQFPEKLIPLMVLKALEGEELPVYGDGENIRDWLFVEDHAAALVAVIERGVAGETYSIGGRAERSNLAVVEAICDILDDCAGPLPRGARRTLIRFVADRPGHDFRYAMRTDKVEGTLGWKPTESFESGLRKTVEWYLANRPWWEMLRDRYAGERLGRSLHAGQ